MTWCWLVPIFCGLSFLRGFLQGAWQDALRWWRQRTSSGEGE